MNKKFYESRGFGGGKKFGYMKYIENRSNNNQIIVLKGHFFSDCKNNLWQPTVEFTNNISKKPVFFDKSSTLKNQKFIFSTHDIESLSFYFPTDVTVSSIEIISIDHVLDHHKEIFKMLTIHGGRINTNIIQKLGIKKKTFDYFDFSIEDSLKKKIKKKLNYEFR